MTTKKATAEKATGLRDALAQFHREFKGVKRTGYNTFTKAHYPTLDDVVNGTNALLDKCGLIVVHLIDGGNVATRVEHAATGEGVASRIPIPTTDDPQKVGAFITYFKRYNLCALLNITEPDDDAEGVKGEAAPEPATDYQIVTLGEFTEDQEISEQNRAWIKQRLEKPLTEAQATDIITRINKAKPNGAT